MKDFLSIKNVTFGYGSRTILEDVSLRFGSGQVVAIMGGSGMGKTTLLKLIGGLHGFVRLRQCRFSHPRTDKLG